MGKEIIERHNIETFEKDTKKEKESILDMAFIKRLRKNKTFRGELVGDLRVALNDNNFLLAKYIEDKIKVYDKFHPKQNIPIASWKGKSGIIEVIIRPTSFVVVRAQKRDQDSKPTKTKNEISMSSVNTVLRAIQDAKQKANKKGGISTRYIAENYCKRLNMDINNHNMKLFDDPQRLDGFIWDNFFSDRKLHTFLNDTLGLLNYYGVIHYRGKFSTPLKDILDIQTVIKQ